MANKINSKLFTLISILPVLGVGVQSTKLYENATSSADWRDIFNDSFPSFLNVGGSNLILIYSLSCSSFWCKTKLCSLLMPDFNLEFIYKLLTIVHTSSQSSQSSYFYFTFDSIIEIFAVSLPKLDPSNTSFSISFFNLRWSVPISMCTVSIFS